MGDVDNRGQDEHEELAGLPTARYDSAAVGPGGQIGPYKLLSILGEGGYGIVYLAEQQQPVKRRVALKVIKPGMDTKQVIARFEAERQALALLDHPNIAQVFDAGTTDAGRPYFAMEYIKGIPITEYCDRYNLGTQERLQLFIPLCQAIQHAHHKGIVHRDIKPSNALVTLREEKPLPKIIDFGVAKALNQRLTERTLVTEQGQFIGTPEYMSPEQAEVTGLDVDTRTDIYSLGVLLYELLTGCIPFGPEELRGKGYAQMQRIICEQEPVKPSTRLTTLGGKLEDIARHRSATAEQLRRFVRGDLDWIVMKAMEKDRTRRYETASALVEDIERHLNNEPVLAGRPGTLYRFQKLVRRNKAVFTAVAVVAAVLVLGASISTWQAVRATEAKQGESRLRQQAETKELAMRQLAYASDMSLAQQALIQDNLGRAQDLLNRHRPKHGEKDLRGWEWRYLWQQCHSDALDQLCQQPSEIWSLAVSPGGQWLAVGEMEKGGLSIWDLGTRQQVMRWVAGDGPVQVAFSPREELLAFSVVTHWTSANPQFSVRLWNGTSRQIVAELPLGGECAGLAFTDDGRTLITYSANPENQVALWRVPEGTKLASHPVSSFDDAGGRKGTPFAVAHDGTVAAVGPDDKICLMDLSDGQIRWTEKATDESVKAIALSPDKKIIASGGGFVESAIRLRDVATGREIARLEGHRAWIPALVFSPDGKTLASASGDQTIRVWDLTDPAHVPPPRVLRGHKLEVWRLALLPDGKTLVSGCKDGSVYLWDTTTTQREHARIILPAAVAAWRFALDGASILTVEVQGLATRWKGTDLQDKEILMDLGGNFDAPTWPFHRTIISRDGRWVATGADDGTITVWDLQAHALARQATIVSSFVLPVEFTAEGKRLVVLYVNDNSFHEWDLATWQQTRSWQGPGPWVVSTFSMDEKLCFMIGQEGAGRLRDMATGRETDQRLDISEIETAAFSPDARLFAATSSLGYARLWETATCRELATFGGFLMGTHSMAFSPDGGRLAIGSDGSEAVKVWDVQSRQELLTLEGQGSSFIPSAFSPDGNVIGSLNRRHQLHLWRAPSWAQIEAVEKGLQTQQLPR